MKEPETSETLGEGFMVSELREPCDEVLEKGESAFTNNVEEKLVGDLYSFGSGINHVDLASAFGGESGEGSLVFDGIGGNNLMDSESLNDYFEDKFSVLMHANDNGSVVISEKNLEICGEVEAHIDKVDQPSIKCGVMLENVDKFVDEGHNVLLPHSPGSPRNLEVSADHINPSVEMFGSLNGISENIDNLDGNTEVDLKLGESESSQEYPLNENGVLSPGIKEVVEHEFTFKSGDLVWANTRKQSWWPGMVSQLKREKRVSFLVKYYGNSSFVWCDYSDLKPFAEYFEQISGQNSSRNFWSSVEKALCEIGQRVKSKMTCACFTKESQTCDENSISGVVSLSLLEPATFYASVKNLACSVYAPGQVELTVLKNCLSSFYCSVGHHELPLQQLSIDDDQNNPDGDEVSHVTTVERKKRNHGDETALSVKGFESRERKKSRYLSYPYVDVIKVSPTEGQEKEDHKSPPTPSKIFHKKGTKKSPKGHIVDKADKVEASSSELLAELFSTAVDCFSLEGSKHSNSLKGFCSRFRMFAFLNVDLAAKEAGKKQAVKKEGNEVVKKSKSKSVNLLISVGGSESTGTDAPHMKENFKKRAKKKKEQVAEAQNQLEGDGTVKEAENQKLNHTSIEGSVENAAGDKFLKAHNPQENIKAEQNKDQAISSSLDSSTNIFINGSGMTSFQQARSNDPVSGPTVKKSRVIPSFLTELSEQIPVGESSIKPAIQPEQNGFTAVSPNVTGVNQNDFTPLSPIITGVNQKVFTPILQKIAGVNNTRMPPNITSVNQKVFPPVSPNISVVNQKAFSPISSSKNAPQESNSVDGPNQNRNEGSTASERRPSAINTGSSSFSRYALKLGIFGSAGTSERKKRKRKEKTTQPASAIPDLNGNMLDANSSGSPVPEGSPVTPQSEASKKRVNKADVGPNGEPLCGKILLNFSPGSNLPPVETLVATFSRFGLLRESELQVLSDSSVRIVYERRSDARFACRSLERGHSFGESLVGFATDSMPPAPIIKPKQNAGILPTSVVDASKNRIKPKEVPSVAFMKKQVDMMKLTLEKSGDSIPPEIKAKVEHEINNFLAKINSTTMGSSS